MEELIYNDCHICLNPHEIKRSTAKAKFTIATACYQGKWYQAADCSISDYGCGRGVGDGHWNDPSFETEDAAIKFCANYIRNQFLGADPNIKGTKHDPKIIAMLDEIINPAPVQLELFG